MKKKVLIAAGGSGGHLFPAQAFGESWLEAHPQDTLLFAGSGLQSNRYFDREKYPYRSVTSATPFVRGWKRRVHAFVALFLGVIKGYQILKDFSPDLVVGFGSFHAFPLLLAAVIRRVPLLLFESNAHAGKVNRFFAPFARCTALHFSDAAAGIKGKSICVKMPMRKVMSPWSAAQAREYFGLHPAKSTLLVFGGSQGSATLNQLIPLALSPSCQVIHLVGKAESVPSVQQQYATLGISACVKDFESRMDLAYLAADLGITRSGAATLSELIAFALPSLLVPYPYATDQHQLKNAQFVQNIVGGALVLEEKELSLAGLKTAIAKGLATREEMQICLRNFSSQAQKETLCTLIETLF